MKEIIVNVDNYNENSIKTIEGDNLSEVYKIYICKNKRRVNLTNKIAVMAYVDEYSSKRSNILNLNITNAAEGEIELPITNVISNENGVYACQIAIYGENNSLEQTAPFSLKVENNIFSKISNAAINSSDFHILSEAIKTTNAYGEKLKEGTENIELQYASKLNNVSTQLNSKANEFDLDVERKRIDLLTEVKNGETEGNTELLDIRVGEDNINYDTAGSAVRTQFKRVNDVSLPSVYLDFIKRVKELQLVGNIEKDMQATFDSLRIIELSTSETGNSGFDIELPNRKINTIEFDIEYCNFGINLGIYFFKEGSIKKSYKGIGEPVSNAVLVRKNVLLEIDWDYVEKIMTDNNFDELRFIVWNQTGAKHGGYNYLTNIRINGFRVAEEVNKAINKLEENMKETLKYGEVGISDIKNMSKEVANSESLIKWGGNSNFICDLETGIINYSYTLDSGNNGFQTKIFNCGNFVVVSGEIISLAGDGINISISGRSVANDSIRYIGIGKINKVGEFTIKCDVSTLFDNEEPLKLNTIAIVFSNSGKIDIAMRDIVVINTDTMLEGDTLEKILNNLYTNSKAYTNEKIKKLQFKDIKNDDIIIAKAENLIPWANGKFIINDDSFTFSHNIDGNSGLITNGFTSKTNFINVKGTVTNINKLDDKGKMAIYVAGYNNEGTFKYINFAIVDKEGDFNAIADLNNFVVYHSLDLKKPIQILFSSIGKIEITVSGYSIFETEVPKDNLLTDNLATSLINIDKGISSINNKLISLDGETNISLVAPNGNKFIFQISNDGSIMTVPVIPKKMLFIGNSLLLGFNTFGMCASDNKHDYYYHVKEYLKKIDSDVICDKLLGAPFEQAETQQGVDSWIINNINNKATDYDLVIVQLGDNVNNEVRNELFKTSCKQLLQAIRNHMQKARVVWVGEWYYTTQRQEIIANSCKETGSTFIDITDLTVTENRGSLGNVITREDGTTFEVVSTGVASHPGDRGMKAIADRIIEKIF